MAPIHNKKVQSVKERNKHRKNRESLVRSNTGIQQLKLTCTQSMLIDFNAICANVSHGQYTSPQSGNTTVAMEGSVSVRFDAARCCSGLAAIY